jgi:Cu2+-exporting ATPase
MKLFSRESGSRKPATQVTCRPGMIRIQNDEVFGSASERWGAFVERLRPLSEIRTIEIDRNRGTAALGFSPEQKNLKTLLERLAQALSTGHRADGLSDLAGLQAHFAGRRQIRLFRREAGFSTWELIHELPGRLRIRDRGLCGRTDLVRQLELELHTLPGVQTVTTSATTGSVLIRFDVRSIDRESLLTALDEMVRCSDILALGRGAPARASFTLANTTLAVATVGEFFFPAVLPVSAILLVATNLPSFRGALNDLGGRRIGLPLVQTSIVAGTLVTGGFIASSMMSWLLLYWQNRHTRRVATARQILGSAVRKQNRTVWVCRENVELETPSSQLQPGDVISVRSGDLLPVDGKVVSGTALVDESVVRGTEGYVCRTITHTILRGSLIVEGELRVEVTRCGDDTVAGRIGQVLDAATGHTTLAFKQHPPSIARRAVSPTLLTAGVGLMVGDVGTAVAILRPDYATGPGIGGALLLVHQLGAALQAGLVVRHAGVFAAMATIDMILLDDHPALWRTELDVAGVIATGPLSADQILQYAELALRGMCDPRSGALTMQCLERGLPVLDLPTNCVADGIEILAGPHPIRVTGLAAFAPPVDAEAVDARADDEAAYDEAADDEAAYDETAYDETVAPLGNARERSARSGDPEHTLEILHDGHSVGRVTFRPGERLAAARALFALRTECGAQVGLLSGDAGSTERSRALGLDFQHACATDEERARFIVECRNSGHRVAFVGDCRGNPAAAAAADVAIALDSQPTDDGDPAGVWLLQPDYGRIATLWEISRTSRRQEQMQHGMTLIPNLACVAGAFLFGFTSLAAVVISNLGTYTVYRRSTTALHETERRLLSRRPPVRPRRRIETARETV